MEEHLIQGTKEWLNYRRGFVTATDSIALMGAAPDNWNKTTPYDVWFSKQEDYVEEEPNFYMKRGKELEDEALRLFEKETGYLMSPVVLVNLRHKFQLASLDGFEIEGKAAVEIKCPGKKDHESAIQGIIPEKYVPQLQHQLAVTGLDKIYYMSYNPDHETTTAIWEVKRDNEYIDKLIEVEEKFFYQHMMTGIPPEKPDKTKIMDSLRWRSNAEEYLTVTQKIKELERYQESLKQRLIDEAGSENARGNGITLQKIEKKGNIMYQNIPMLKTMNLDEFRKPATSYWQVKGSNDETN